MKITDFHILRETHIQSQNLGVVHHFTLPSNGPLISENTIDSNIYQDEITPVYCTYQQRQKLLLQSARFGLHEF
jgi:hypothetical protein